MAASTPEDPYEVQLQLSSGYHNVASLTTRHNTGAASATDGLPR